MPDRYTILMYRRLYRWYGPGATALGSTEPHLRGRLYLRRYAPDIEPGQSVEARITEPLWPTPCPRWWRWQQEKQVAESRVVAERKARAALQAVRDG